MALNNDDVIVAGAGNDIIDGGLGDDTITAAEGDDTIIFDPNDTQRIDGGFGLDTLQINGAGTTLNLPMLNTT